MLEITLVDKDKAPDHDIDQGTPRTLEATTHLQLPDGYRADLPDAIHVKRDYATFDKTYRMDKSELICERKVVILKKKVPKADWKDYAAYLKSTGVEEGENYISLFSSGPAPKPSAPVTLTVDPKTGNKTGTVQLTPPAPTNDASPGHPTLADPDLFELRKQAEELEVARDWDGAKSKLLQITQTKPDYPYVMSMLGYIAMQQGKADEAIDDVKVELKNHPDPDASIVTQLAYLYEKQKHDDQAVALLKSYSDRHDITISGALAMFQVRMGDSAGAVCDVTRRRYRASRESRTEGTARLYAEHSSSQCRSGGCCEGSPGRSRRRGDAERRGLRTGPHEGRPSSRRERLQAGRRITGNRIGADQSAGSEYQSLPADQPPHRILGYARLDPVSRK